MPNDGVWGYNAVSDAEADEWFDRYKDGDYDDWPEIEDDLPPISQLDS